MRSISSQYHQRWLPKLPNSVTFLLLIKQFHSMTFYFASLDFSGCVEKIAATVVSIPDNNDCWLYFFEVNDEKLMKEFIEGYSHYLLCEIKQWSFNE